MGRWKVDAAAKLCLRWLLSSGDDGIEKEEADEQMNNERFFFSKFSIFRIFKFSNFFGSVAPVHS